MCAQTETHASGIGHGCRNKEKKKTALLLLARILAYWGAYIIAHYNPSIRIVDLVSHTTYVVCVNFIHK